MNIVAHHLAAYAMDMEVGYKVHDAPPPKCIQDYEKELASVRRDGVLASSTNA